MIRAGILGGDGFAAGELIRLLINHPDVELTWVHSPLHCGQMLTEVHQGMEGETYLRFTDEADFDNIDILFCCYPHGHARRLLDAAELPSTLRIIDMSRDYRIEDGTHDFVYGLPELNRKRIVRGATRVANPGSFATAVELALLPLAKNLLLNTPVHITAITGFSGSAVEKTTPDQLAWHRDNVSLYKPLAHQHLPEIRQALTALQSTFDAPIHFIPMRGSFARGMLATIYMDMNVRTRPAAGHLRRILRRPLVHLHSRPPARPQGRGQHQQMSPPPRKSRRQATHHGRCRQHPPGCSRTGRPQHEPTLRPARTRGAGTEVQHYLNSPILIPDKTIYLTP